MGWPRQPGPMGLDDRPAPPPDPWLTPERQLMLDIGWLDLWHALREEAESAQPGPAPKAADGVSRRRRPQYH